MTKAEITKNRANRVSRIAEQIKDDYHVTIVEYLKSKDGEYNWLFNWKGGGFNDVWAKTKKEALKKAKELGYPTYMPDNEYARERSLKDVLDTFGRSALHKVRKRNPDLKLTDVGFSKGLVPDETSLRKATRETSNAQNREGWLMTI